MKIDESLALDETNYVAAKKPKSLIVLHHTVGGSAASTVKWWKQDPRRVGTAYVVERDGTVLQCFPPECWASHLGVRGAPADLESRSIGIELASEGALRDGNQMNLIAQTHGLTAHFDPAWLYGFDCDVPPGDLSKARGVYHVERNNAEYVTYAAPGYRSYQYFDAYDEPQVAAAIELVGMLAARFKIPLVIPRDVVAPEVNPLKRLAWKGILHHACVRADKSDLHPAFPWERLAVAIGATFA